MSPKKSGDRLRGAEDNGVEPTEAHGEERF